MLGQGGKGAAWDVKCAFGTEGFDELPFGLLHGAQGLDRLDAGDDDLQSASLRPHVHATDDDDLAADLDGGVDVQASAAPHHAVHLAVIVSQREVDVPVVNAPRGDFTQQSLMLKQRVVLHGALDQLRKLTDGQRARRRLVAR